MDSKQLKARLEELGFDIAHVRRKAYTTELRAYIAASYGLDEKDVAYLLSVRCDNICRKIK